MKLTLLTCVSGNFHPPDLHPPDLHPPDLNPPGRSSPELRTGTSRERSREFLRESSREPLRPAVRCSSRVGLGSEADGDTSELPRGEMVNRLPYPP